MQKSELTEEARPADATVLTTIARLADEFPWVEETAVDAHLSLMRAHAVYEAALSSQYEKLELSIPRFNLLRFLYHAITPGLTISELGAYLDVSVPNVMRMVQALESEGWLCSVKSDTDRRVTNVELTEVGRKRFAALLPQALVIWEELWSGLSDEEKRALSELLSKLRLSLLTRYLDRPGLASYRLDAQRKQRPKRAKRPKAE